MNVLKNKIIRLLHNNEYKKLEDIERMLMPKEQNEKGFDSKLNIELFPHQIQSVKSMENLEYTRVVDANISEKYGYSHVITDMGILGDIPGYGKSLSIVSLLARDKMKWDENTDYSKHFLNHVGHNQMFEFYSETKSLKIRESLIVVSTSIISQWEEYLNYSDLNYLSVIDRKTAESFKPNTYDVVLVSSTMYNMLVQNLNFKGDYSWKRFIYDEPGVTHIPAMLPVSAGFYWFVTATFDDLCYTAGRKGNNGHFLHNIFRNLLRDKLKTLTIKNDDNFVKNSFKMPETRYVFHECLNPLVLRAIRNYIPQEISIMIQAGNIKGALEALGSDEKGDIMEIVTKKKEDELKVAQFKVDYYKNKKDHAKEYDKWKERVEFIKKQITDLETKYRDMEKEDCPICMCELENPVLLPCCQHLFCGGCILKCSETKNSCPMCRSVIHFQNVTSIVSKDKHSKKDTRYIPNKPKSKQDCLIDLIKRELQYNPRKKFIVFSSYDETFDLIRNDFKTGDISFVELTGTKAMKNKRLNSYRNGDTSVIFLNSKTNCAGINLQETTDIILYHDMDEMYETQIIGRANRIGRKEDLTVHRFIYV